MRVAVCDVQPLVLENVKKRIAVRNGYERFICTEGSGELGAYFIGQLSEKKENKIAGDTDRIAKYGGDV